MRLKHTIKLITITIIVLGGDQTLSQDINNLNRTTAKLDLIERWIASPNLSKKPSIYTDCIDIENLSKYSQFITTIPPRTLNKNGITQLASTRLYNRAKNLLPHLEKLRLSTLNCYQKTLVSSDSKLDQNLSRNRLKYAKTLNTKFNRPHIRIQTNGSSHDILIISLDEPASTETLKSFKVELNKPRTTRLGPATTSELLSLHKFRKVLIRAPMTRDFIAFQKSYPRNSHKAALLILKRKNLHKKLSMKHNTLHLIPKKDSLLNVLCESKHHPHDTCNTCPSYTFFNDSKDMSISPESAILLNTSSKEKHLLITLKGCGSHIHNDMLTLLLKTTKNSWKILSSHPGMNLENCLHTAKEWPDQNALICTTREAGGGTITETIHAFIRHKNTYKQVNILTLEDNSNSGYSSKFNKEKLFKITAGPGQSLIINYTGAYGVAPTPYSDWIEAEEGGVPLPKSRNLFKIFKLKNGSFIKTNQSSD